MNKTKLRIWNKKDTEWLKKNTWLGHYDDLYVDDLQNILNDPDYIFIFDTDDNIVKEKETPSKLIKDMVYKMEYDYSDPCGANNCECYQNKQMIEAILIYLDKLCPNK